MAGDDKATRRAAILAARRAVPAAVHAEEAQRISAHLDSVVRGVHLVCAYVPTGVEPGSSLMLDKLNERCEVLLLPVTCISPEGEHLPLQWGRYEPGTLVPARWGLSEPPRPWLPAETITRADLVLVPALAVDRAGVRLGRGGGFYDRTLALCRPGTMLVAVVRDDELVDRLPGETHDVRMTHALTPGLGLVALGECAASDGGSST